MHVPSSRAPMMRTPILILSTISLLLALFGGLLLVVTNQHMLAYAQAAEITYGPPLTITQGGTYSGNWASTDPTVPAVLIQTTAPVVIENCHVRGPGNLISTKLSDSQNTSNATVTVRNCSGIGLMPSTSGWPEGYFFQAVWFTRVDIENNTIQGTRGISLTGQNQSGTQQDVTVLRNQAYNINGSTSDGATCAISGSFVSDDGACGANFLILNGTLDVPNIEIAWNSVINAPDQSQMDDNIDIYNSSGTSASPLLIHDNYIQGAYPEHPESDTTYTGSGIDVADGDSQVDAAHATAYVHAYQNQVVSSANVGIFIASGHDNSIYDNRVVSSGYLPNGQTIKNHFTGVYVWDCCYGQTQKNPPVFYNNTAHDNVIGYAYIDANGQYQRNDTYLPNCAVDANGASLCTNNVSLPNPITLDTEHAEYMLWLQKLSANNVSVGAIDFSSGLESGDPPPSWTNSVDNAGYPAGGISNITGVCCGPELGVRSEGAHTGSNSLLYSGSATSSGGPDFAYLQAFDFSGQPIPVGANTTLSYWIYPQSSSWAGVSGTNSTCVAIDLIFSDGSNLRDSGAIDQNGNRAHPASQCNHLTLDSWNHVIVNVGVVKSGTAITRLDLGYDQPDSTGGYRGYLDDVSLLN